MSRRDASHPAVGEEFSCVHAMRDGNKLDLGRYHRGPALSSRRVSTGSLRRNRLPSCILGRPETCPKGCPSTIGKTSVIGSEAGAVMRRGYGNQVGHAERANVCVLGVEPGRYSLCYMLLYGRVRENMTYYCCGFAVWKRHSAISRDLSQTSCGTFCRFAKRDNAFS